ncbi:hypothetical protein [Streptomyces sp. NRRL F-5053]|uniref:hypothetical protein n=1 Tax=Streptomyces sp. NRRL F-5053 TaxID=1463854 RepID=UPI0004CAD54E|nr:hypothetical protein [Streptomyces sp. NRRL F-5053]
MAEDERVPGSTASLESGADVSEAASQFERRLEDLLFGGNPAEHMDVVHADAWRVVLLGRHHAGTSFESTPFDVDLVVQLKSHRASRFDEDFRRKLREALAARNRLQPTLPGLTDPAGKSGGASDRDRALQISAAVLEGLGAERLSRLREQIAEATSATEVPVRALRNPGKVLDELAEKGQIARVTNHGRIVGWLMPATEAEQHVDDLLKQGRLRRGTPAPIEPVDTEGLERPLSEVLTQARDGERS